MHHIRRDLLCFYSKYFDAALNGPFEVTFDADHIFTLEDTNDHVLSAFATWTTTGRLYLNPESSQYSFLDDRFLVKLYILADKIDCLALRRMIMTILVAKEKLPAYSVIELAVTNLPTSSPLMALFALRRGTLTGRRWFPEHYEAMREALVSFMRKVTFEYYEWSPGIGHCVFHEHASRAEFRASKCNHKPFVSCDSF